MKNYVLLVDVGKCTQCHACVLACKDEHFGSDYPPYTLGQQELGEHWINMRIEERGSGSKVRAVCWPELCLHCKTPACMDNNPAVTKNSDGIVLIDQAAAKGNRTLADACPYNAIAWNGELSLPQKCTLCAHLLDAGDVPRCVESCPNGTMLFGDLSDAGSEVSRVVAGVPELRAQDSIVRYYNKPGRFAAGSVYHSESEVAAGAAVKLIAGGAVIAETITNGFGDFRFDCLPDSKECQIEITCDGYETLLLSADAENDVCWEEIFTAKNRY